MIRIEAKLMNFPKTIFHRLIMLILKQICDEFRFKNKIRWIAASWFLKRKKKAVKLLKRYCGCDNDLLIE